MKKIVLIIVALCTALSVSAFCLFTTVSHNKSIRGSGKIVTRTIDALQFEAIDASRAVKVIVTDNTSDKITISADDNLIDLVVVRVSNGELDITMDKEYTSIQNANVTVSVPAPAGNRIESLEASSASNINCKVKLTASDFSMKASSAAGIYAAVKANSCEIDASSAAKISAVVKAAGCEIDASSGSEIKAAIETTTCDIQTSSASSIQLTGSSDKCTAHLSSGSEIAADSFVVTNYEIRASSGSEATINCAKKLNASASSGASIYYKGDATIVEVSKSSGGSISRK